MTTSFVNLLATVQQSTTPEFYLVFCHCLAALAREDAPTTGATVAQAMRDVGAPEGQHKPLGAPTRPLTLTMVGDPTDPDHRKAY